MARRIATLLLVTVLLAGCVTASPSAPHETLPQPSPLPSDGTTCSPTPIHMGDYTGPDSSLRGIPWIAAEPDSSGITGHLFFSARGDLALHTDGQAPDGPTMKVLWVVDNPRAAATIDVSGRNLSGGGSYQDRFKTIGGGEFPSILNLPTAGCWVLDVKSGQLAGQMTILAVGY